MKFSIRELMVLTLAVASVVGWIADRRRLCDALDKAEQKSEEAALKIRELKEVNLVVATAGQNSTVRTKELELQIEQIQKLLPEHGLELLTEGRVGGETRPILMKRLPAH